MADYNQQEVVRIVARNVQDIKNKAYQLLNEEEEKAKTSALNHLTGPKSMKEQHKQDALQYFHASIMLLDLADWIDAQKFHKNVKKIENG